MAVPMAEVSGSGGGAPRPPSAGGSSGRLVLTVALVVVVFALGTLLGVAVSSDDDDAPARTAPRGAVASRTSDATTAGSSTPTVASDAGAIPVGLADTVRGYVGALVDHDWPRAHALMCVDLAERITAGGLKRELAGSERRAGILRGYTLTEQPKPKARTAQVGYTLEFARGSLAVTADLEREGPTWRVCSFTNGDGTGAFA